MDEPLYFGHEYDKQHACRWSIPEVAQNVASAIVDTPTEGMLPENLPGTMTHLVLQYLEIHH
jgi:hypothetical protein